MKMKKFLALAAALALSLSLAACGGGGGGASTDGGDSGDGGGASTSGNTNMTFVMGSRDEFLSTLEAGAKKAASDLGVNLTTVDSQNDASKAIQYVETARNAGEPGIVVNVVGSDQAPAVMEAAGDMKMVLVNRTPEDMAILNENVVYVGSNEMDSGKYQGEALAEYFKALGQTDIKYILLSGTLGHTAQINRTKSCLESLEANGINATEASAPLVCDWDRATAMDMITPLLTSGLEFDCIIANNDAMALGAVEAMEGAGLDPSSVPIVGVDCTADGAAAVASGKMLMTVFQNADGQGRASIQACMNLINGDPIEKDTGYEVDSENPYILWVPFEPVYASNVADYQ